MLAIAVVACAAKPTLDVNLAAKDLTPPQVVSITPPNGATEVLDKPTIVIAFNEDMDPGTLNSSTVTVKTANGSPGIGSYEYDRAQKALSIKIVQSLYLNTAYTITVTSAVKDLAGNAIVPVTSTFSTDVCPKSRKSIPGFNGDVRAIAKVGCTLYVGGEFTSVGQAYAYGLGLDSVTGKADGFTYEDINGSVNVAVSDGNGGWYIGGDFTQIGPYTRNRLAHILSNGEISPWNPNANSIVYALAVSGSTVYVGGDFTSIGGVTRNRLAAIHTDGTLQAWDPNANDIVYALAVSGTTVYVGGSFTSIGGQTRNYLAAIGTDGVLQSWDPNPSSTVYALAVSGLTVYVGGGFTTIGGQARNRLAAIDISNSCLTAYSPSCLQSWDPNANSTVFALATNSSTVYAGGWFTSIGGQTRNKLAAIGTDGSLVTFWDPNANNSVYALAVTGSTVYAGGFFSCFGNCPSGTEGFNKWTRNGLAAIGTDGSVQDWNPNADGTVRALAATGTTVYAGGDFTTISGTPRNRLAAIGTDGSLQFWNPDAGGFSPAVYALAVSGTTVYAGGSFTSIGGTSRNRLAAIGTDGSLQSWDPNTNNIVRALTVSGSTVYVGGQFTTIGSQARNYLAAIDSGNSCLTSYNPTSCLQPWNPHANNWVLALAVSGSTVHAGGDFTTIGSTTSNYLAAIDIGNSCLTAFSSSCLQPWNPNANSTVFALAVSGSTVYAGGVFTSIGGQMRDRLAAIHTDGSLQSWNPNANNYVYALAVSGSTVYAGGSFTSIGGIPRNRIVSINADGSVNW
jgi:hypothetical protein